METPNRPAETNSNHKDTDAYNDGEGPPKDAAGAYNDATVMQDHAKDVVPARGQAVSQHGDNIWVFVGVGSGILLVLLSLGTLVS